MKFFKILPAAAGVIALTATVSFARDQRECEEDGFCRTIIVVRDAGSGTNDAAPNYLPGTVAQESENVYHVQVVRGSKTKLVSIDAYTGKILANRDVSATTV